MTATAGPGFGTNSWLVEEMYEQFRADPESVGEAWREFFADYKSITPEAPSAPPPREPATTPKPTALELQRVADATEAPRPAAQPARRQRAAGTVPGAPSPPVIVDCPAGETPTDIDGYGCALECAPVACPAVVVDCPAGETPTDIDGDGCALECAPVVCPAIYVECPAGQVPGDTDGDGCALECVPRAPPATPSK